MVDDANGFDDIFVRDREGWTYAIGGTVRDDYGNPVAGVWVGYGTKGGESKLTDTNGEYQLPYMPEGTYSIRAWKIGFLSIPFERVLNLTHTTIGVDFVITPARLLYLPLGKK